MIRHAEPEDAEEIHDTALKSWKDTYRPILSESIIEEVIKEWYKVEDLREQTQNPIFYVAEKENKIIGFVHATVKDGKATLHRIYLDPEYQGQGIGSRLYKKAENDIEQKEADRIELKVLAENNKGNSFYMKQDFEELKTEETDLKGEKVEQKILIKRLSRSRRADLDRFWAKSLGCCKADLNFKDSKIVTRKEETGYNKDRTQQEIDIFQLNGERIISCPTKVEDRLRKHEAKLLNTDITEKAVENIGIKVKELLGPAFLSYTIQEEFNKVKTENCRKLKQEESEKLEKLKHESNKEEIENSIGNTKISDSPVFGKFTGGKLVAVSSYTVWNNIIGFLNVFVKEEFRGKGYGKQVVSKATENMLENELIPVYRTLEKWSSSVGLAKSLGYKKYAETHLLKLEKLSIRPYNFKTDAESHAKVHRESVRGIASEDYRNDVIEAWSSKEPEDKPLDEEKVRFVAETEDGEIVGFSDYDKETNELSGLYVKPDYMGQGVGGALLGKVEEDAQKNGLDHLWCKSTITAKDFYQNKGYEILQKTKHELEEGLKMEAYKMEKKF